MMSKGGKNGHWLRGFLDEHTGWAIVAAVGLGVLLLAIALVTYTCFCGWPGKYALSFTCNAIRNRPPWTLLTALVAAPSAVLTWYWRTAHKKRDLELTHAEERNVRFATAVQLLEAEAAGAIFALERLTKESPEDHWQVMQTLAAAIRGWSGPGQRIDKIHQDGVRFQALVDALGRREIAHDPPGAVINLSGARLGELNFRGLDFTGACFDDATISRADLRGTNLIGASFANAKAVGAWIDDDTKLDDLATMTLQHAGARFDTLAIRKMQEFIDRDSAKAIADRDALLKGLVDQAKKP